MSLEFNFLISENDKKWCGENKVRITWPGRADYPECFLDLPCRPAALFYIGQPVWLTHPLVSVVGSRTPQTSSLNWLEDILSQALRKYDLAVVSGGAYGIDQKAHQLALRAERPTVLFLPSGLKHVYPPVLHEWIEPILAAGGCLVSQFLPSMGMQKRYFRERNRLIAAISPLTMIVECKRRSGTMLTAKFAHGLDKKLVVMPTFPGEAGLGGLDLICDFFAVPLRDFADFESALSDSAKLNQRKNKENEIGAP